MADPTPKSVIYVDEETGQDETTATGTQQLPYRSLPYAYIRTDGTAEYQVKKVVQPGAAEGEQPIGFQPAAKAALKKAVNALKEFQKKASKEKELETKRLKEDEARAIALEEAKKIVIEEDMSLPEAKKIKLDQTEGITLKKDGVVGTRVMVYGRAHTVRKQKDVFFIELKDGYGKMQCVLSGQLAKTFDAITLTRESSMMLKGTLCELPAGARAPLGRELQVDYFKLPKNGKAAGGDDAITTRVAHDTEQHILLDLRHLTLRGDNASQVMIVRDQVEWAFNTAFRELRFRKVSPPALVQTQVEGGATLFKFDYYGQESFLTQSSQLYLETCIPSMGDVYCIEKSFRAEKSLTRRHLSEYTHVEAELDFITFDDLLTHLEAIICRVIDLTLSDPTIAAHIERLNPGFTPPARPFLRMKYSDAIQWLIDHKIENEEGKPHEFGDDIAEAAERRMTDIINKPIFLTHFPVAIKAFYMQKDVEDLRVTESVDCLMPGVGEIVGGSMRIDDWEELMAAYKREGIDPAGYGWYTDQRKYGSSPHGGYGLGLERFLAWLCKLHTVREACLYPRYMGRCTP
ncbi:asparaginyl-tRNA synthetase, cytoplasmic [Microthyrium microscopicum]|uniref:asparagine--tRNA ligase n=1 Tax=Microthyrium microscopicum TaxID=703497 RepID=A0A6A6UJL3_9PEZI|nr:asparaginyl-tRNA synthetase, cytoplasmic [Microthyrium microscopicum]